MNQIAAAGRSAHFPSFKMLRPASGVQKKEGDFGYSIVFLRDLQRMQNLNFFPKKKNPCSLVHFCSRQADQQLYFNLLFSFSRFFFAGDGDRPERVRPGGAGGTGGGAVLRAGKGHCRRYVVRTVY